MKVSPATNIFLYAKIIRYIVLIAGIRSKLELWIGMRIFSVASAQKKA
jgi:hypothetical protein